MAQIPGAGVSQVAKVPGTSGAPADLSGELRPLPPYMQNPLAAAAAIISGWTGIWFVLWIATAAAVLGALIGLFGLAGSQFGQAVGNSPAGPTVTVLAVLGTGVALGVAALAFFSGVMIGGNPFQLAGTLAGAALLAAGVVWALERVEGYILVLHGYRRPSKAEGRLIADAAEDAIHTLEIGMPIWGIFDSHVPRAWTYQRSIILSTGLLENLTPGELKAVIAHELCHYDLRHSAGVLFVRASALPIAIAYNIGAWLIGEPMEPGMPGARHGAIPQIIGWVLFWPAILLTRWLIAPLLAQSQRENEYLADLVAVRLGYGPAMASALEKIGMFEAGQRGFLAAITRTHPPIPLRIERLRPSGDPTPPELAPPIHRGLAIAVMAVVVAIALWGAVLAHRTAASAPSGGSLQTIFSQQPAGATPSQGAFPPITQGTAPDCTITPPPMGCPLPTPS